MARNEIAKKFVRTDATGVDFNFANGVSLPVDIANLPETINYKGGSVSTIALFACHGLSQKIGDSYAGSKSEPDPMAAAIQWANDTWENIQNGDWSEAREGAAPGAPTSRVVRAVIVVLTAHGKPIDEAALQTKYKSKEAKDKALANAEVKAAYDAILAEEYAARAAASKAKAGEQPAADLDELAA